MAHAGGRPAGPRVAAGPCGAAGQGLVRADAAGRVAVRRPRPFRARRRRSLAQRARPARRSLPRPAARHARPGTAGLPAVERIRRAVAAWPAWRGRRAAGDAGVRLRARAPGTCAGPGAVPIAVAGRAVGLAGIDGQGLAGRVRSLRVETRRARGARAPARQRARPVRPLGRCRRGRLRGARAVAGIPPRLRRAGERADAPARGCAGDRRTGGDADGIARPHRTRQRASQDRRTGTAVAPDPARSR